MTSTNWVKIDSLIARQQRRGIDIRPTLLDMLTDVYVGAADPSPDETAQYAEIALRLISEVDDATRLAVVRRLRDCPHAPPTLVDRLSDPASPFAGARSAPATACEASGSADAAVGRRFFAADAAERRRILADFDGAGSPPPPGDTIRVVASLESSALAGRPGEFIRTLERALQLPRETAERIVNDTGGEPMVVAARALGMPLAVLQRILMFLNPAIGHSVRRVYDLSDLYEQVTPSAARRLTAAWSGSRADERGSGSPPERARRDDSLRAAAVSRPVARALPTMPTRRTQRTS